MDRIQFEKILNRYLQGQATPDEKKLLDDLFLRQQKINFVYEDFDPEDKERIKNEMFRCLHQKVDRGAEKIQRGVVWLRAWKVAASVLLVAGLITVFSIVYRQNSEVNYLVVSTTKGEKKQVTLQDGSVVYLNSESSLKYPNRFSGNTREVALSGEAFFEIRKNRKKAFIVRSGAINTRVLGTRFNVRNFADQLPEVTVLSGRVKVYKGEGPDSHEVILTANRQVTYNKSENLMLVGSVNASRLVAWKDDRLIIDNKPLVHVAAVIQKWYGVPVVIEHPALDSCLFTTDMQHEPLQVLLEDLQHTLSLEYKFQDSILHLSGKGCD